MNKKTVLAVFGTRPEAIKMAPLVLALRESGDLDCRVCITAQHRELLDAVLDSFSLTADYDLDIMKPDQTLCGIASAVMDGLGGVLRDCAPDAVLVHGDTATTLCAALAAFYSRVPVGHVEAGLRTYDKASPFPEEGNRLCASALAELHFAPTVQNRDNLAKENITKNVFITGNTVIDALRYTVRDGYRFESGALRDVLARGKPVIFVTAHRRENFGAPHENAFRALRRIAAEFPAYELFYPVHPNPNVRARAQEFLGGVANITLAEPISTGDSHNLMARCRLIVTDSGGLQEEGPSLGRPVLVLRRETERPEAVRAGTVRLCGVEEEAVYRSVKELLCDTAVYERMARAVNPYGDGHASERIREALRWYFGLRAERPADFLPEVR